VGQVGHVQVEIAVMVVVDEGDANATLSLADADGLRDVVEFGVTLIRYCWEANERHRLNIPQGRCAIVVEITARNPGRCLSVAIPAACVTSANRPAAQIVEQATDTV